MVALTFTVVHDIQITVGASLVYYSVAHADQRGRTYVTDRGNLRPVTSRSDRAYLLGYLYGWGMRAGTMTDPFTFRYRSLFRSAQEKAPESWWEGVQDSGDDHERTLMDYTAYDIRDLPTLATGQSQDLKIDTGSRRVWLCRVTDTVEHERLIDGRWEDVT